MKYLSPRGVTSAVFLLVAAGLSFWFVVQPRTLPPIIILPMPNAAPKPMSWRTRLMQKIPGWAWRLKFALLGPARGIDLEAIVLQFPTDSSATLSNLSLGAPQFASNAVTAWVLSPEMLKAFRGHCKEELQHAILFHPRIATSDGVEATLNTGNSLQIAGPPMVVGLMFNCDPHARGHGIDLKTSLCVTEAVTNQNGATASISVVTNLALAARMQIPNLGGIFVLAPAVRQGKQIGTVISGAMR